MASIASRQFASWVCPDETRGLKLWSPSGQPVYPNLIGQRVVADLGCVSKRVAVALKDERRVWSAFRCSTLNWPGLPVG